MKENLWEILFLEDLNQNKRDKKMIPYIDIEHLKERSHENRLCRMKYKILERDNFKCVVCGSREQLTIAHVHGLYKHKGRKWNDYKLNDCQTKCSSCHTKENRIERKKAIAHRFRYT